MSLDDEWVRTARAAALPFRGSVDEGDALLDIVGDADIVLIGEASHGTHEFYFERAELTKRLITERGFCAVTAEADWPDAYGVNRWVRGAGDAGDAEEALAGFKRFPAWMWRNADVLDFVGWLRDHNDALPPSLPKVGFYGLDLYSLHASIAEVIDVLAEIDPPSAERARRRYECFEGFGPEPQDYGYLTSLDLAADCSHQVIEQLVELQRRRAQALVDDRETGPLDDDLFDAEQNARVVQNAERYYRAMFEAGVSTWNLRDRHMADTFLALRRHLAIHAGHAGDAGPRVGAAPKMVVWAHNSHVGDARATHRGAIGEVTIGQLLRERAPSLDGAEGGAARTCLIGMTTHGGTVTAASDWGQPAERKRVRPALPGSHEDIFHRTGIPRFVLRTDDVRSVFDEARLERAIGVVYRPETERQSHWFDVFLAEQFDAVIHIDETRALEPLERAAEAPREELPETYPSGI